MWTTRIVLARTAIEEVEKYHLETLKLAVNEANVERAVSETLRRLSFE